MTVADWGDIRASSGVQPARPGDARAVAGPAQPVGAGQLGAVAARSAARRAPLAPMTQLALAVLGVAAAVVGVVHQDAVRMLTHQSWPATHTAVAILNWPNGMAQLVGCLAGAGLLVAGAVSSAAMRNAGGIDGWLLLGGGAVSLLGLLPALIVLVMYAVMGVLFVAVCAAVGIGLLMILFGALADL